MDISNSATVYIVDDDDAVRDSFRSLLESHGLTVRDSKVGCLLLDLHMPGMTGLQLLGKLRRDRSRLPLIAITGRIDTMLKQQIAQAGAFALLEKPMNDEVLMWTIESAVATRPPVV